MEEAPIDWSRPPKTSTAYPECLVSLVEVKQRPGWSSSFGYGASGGRWVGSGSHRGPAGHQPLGRGNGKNLPGAFLATETGRPEVTWDGVGASGLRVLPYLGAPCKVFTRVMDFCGMDPDGPQLRAVSGFLIRSSSSPSSSPRGPPHPLRAVANEAHGGCGCRSHGDHGASVQPSGPSLRAHLFGPIPTWCRAPRMVKIPLPVVRRCASCLGSAFDPP